MALKLQLVVDDSPSLHRWLRDEEDVARHVQLSMIADPLAPPAAGAEIIEAVASNSLAVMSLLISYLQWRSGRESTLTVRNGDRQFVLRAGSPEEIAQVIASLED